MPLRDDMQLVSTDDHVIEHANVWLDRLPKKFLDVAPRVVTTTGSTIDEFGNPMDPNQQVWQFDGEFYAQLGLNAVAGKPREEFGEDPVRYEDMRPGCYDPVERVKDMDIDGLHVAMCFPNFPRFGGTVFRESRDPELALLCTQAWNDFMIDEWCAVAPDRFIPLMIVPFWDVDASVREVHRMAAKGMRAVSFPENPVPLGYPSFHTTHWDKLWSALEELDMPLCLHFGSSGKPPNTAPDAPVAVMITLMGCNSMYAAADLLFSPTFQRHPRLKVALSEGGIGWMPYILERADYTWDRQRFYQDINQEEKPSEVFRRHIWGCFIDDPTGIRNRYEIGIDRITWESDYPHSDSNWPHSRKVLNDMMLEVPDDEVSRMVEFNARELFNFPRATS